MKCAECGFDIEANYPNLDSLIFIETWKISTNEIVKKELECPNCNSPISSTPPARGY